MAINYGSTNLGGADRGGFAIYGVQDTVGGGVISVLDADIVTGQVTAVTNAVPLTSLQVSALSIVFKKLIQNVGTVAGNQLEYLRKLVGVVSMTTGPTVTLSAAPQGGNVWRLEATLSAAGSALVYVPNSAAAGLFTGDGSSAGAGGPPTGVAGGVLGYPGSTYPNPTGLAADGLDVIAIKAPIGGTGAVKFKIDDVLVGLGQGLVLSSGGTSEANKATGAIGLQTPTGPNAAGGAKGGNGGFIGLIAGDGGQGAPGLRSGTGGSIIISSGNTGALNGGIAPLVGSQIALQADDSAIAQTGGSVFIGAGKGSVTNGNVIIGSGPTSGGCSEIVLNAVVRESTNGIGLNVVGGEVVGTANALVSLYYLINTTGGPITLNAATPVVNGSLAYSGLRVALIGSNLTDDIVVPVGGNVLLSGGANKTIGSNGYLELLWNGSKWIQTAYVQTNS